TPRRRRGRLRRETDTPRPASPTCPGAVGAGTRPGGAVPRGRTLPRQEGKSLRVVRRAPPRPSLLPRHSRRRAARLEASGTPRGALRRGFRSCRGLIVVVLFGLELCGRLASLLAQSAALLCWGEQK